MSDRLHIVLRPKEKESFTKAAELAGVSVTAWARQRLRNASRIELSEAGLGVPHLNLLTKPPEIS